MNAVVGAMPANARWALRSVLVMICAVGLLAASGGSALAKKHKPKPEKPPITAHTPITRGSTYLALGDSVTFGYEEAQVVPAPTYTDASSFFGFPELMGSALHLKVANAACPGETSASLINDKAQSYACENAAVPGTPAYRQLFPLHVHYTGSQLAFAVSYLRKHHDVRLVSLMIGANDFFVCQATTPDHCTSPAEELAVGESISKNVRTILSTIRNEGHYGGQVAIVNYYSSDYSSPTINAQIGAINQVVDNAAAPFHVEVADGFGALEAGAAHSGGNSCNAGLLTQLVHASTPCGIHPSRAGQGLLALALEQAVRLG